MTIKATDNPSLAFICFVERFVVALLSVYARMPDFANNACKQCVQTMRANNDNMRKTPFVKCFNHAHITGLIFFMSKYFT